MDDPQVEDVSSNTRNEAGASTPVPDNLVNRIIKLINAIEKKLCSSITVESSKDICKYLKELRTYISCNDDYMSYVMNQGFIVKLVSLLSRCTEHRHILGDALRCIVPYLRSVIFKTEVHEILCEYQTIKILLVSIRRYSEDESITIQSSEIIYGIMDHILIKNNATIINENVSFMIMYGALKLFPPLILFFLDREQDIPLRRYIAGIEAHK
jgi:hypothetical protein